MIDGETINDPSVILRDGSKLVYHRIPWKEPEAPYLLEVLYDDGDMIALNKPSGLQVLPGGLFQQRTVLTQLQWHANKNSNSPGQELHPVPVHRLGRGTSGVLLCAKTKHAKTRLAAYFADGTSLVRGKRETSSEFAVERRITKMYRALVRGIIDVNEIVIDQPIGTMRYPGVAKGLYVALPSGKPALSKVGVLERDVEKDQTLVQSRYSQEGPTKYVYIFLLLGIRCWVIHFMLLAVRQSALVLRLQMKVSRKMEGISGLLNLFQETVGIICMRMK